MASAIPALGWGSALGLVVLCLALGCPHSAGARDAYVKGEVRLNLRSGPGNEYRIIGGVTTGDKLRVLEQSENKRWTKVSGADGIGGWIPGGYLDDQLPAAQRAVELEAQVERLTAELEATGAEAATLRTSNDELSAADGTQRAEIEQLRTENVELRAGARWPEWITGALILSTGMALGALLRSVSGRRRQSRLRL